MALNANNLVVGNSGSILWGTTGITLPTTAAASVASFNDLGYLDEDGLTVSVAPNVTDFNVWQSRQPARRTFTGQNITLSGNLAEWNAQSVPRVFGGGALTTGTYAFPTDTASLEEFAVVADAVDGADVHRFVFGRANQTEEVSVQFNRTNLAVLPFNFSVLAPAAGGSPGNYYTNSV
jgi:hypothetical protein